MIFKRSARVHIKSFEWNPADYSHIMLSKQAGEVGYITHQFHDCIGVTSITHHIAHAPCVIDGAGLLQNSFEGRVIRVHIRDHQNSHITPKVLQPAPKSLQPPLSCSSMAILPAAHS